MLAELRKHSKSVIIYVLFGIIIVVFVFTFNMSSRRRQASVHYKQDKGNVALVSVGDATIDTVDLEMGLRLTIDPPVPGKPRTADTDQQEKMYRMSRFQEFRGDPATTLFGRDPWTVPLVKSKKVKDDLIETWLVSEEARKNGLVASPAEVRDRIVERFSDPASGEFKRGYYENWVRYQLRSSLARFEDFVAREIEREKMISMVTSAVTVPEREARYVAAMRKNVRNYEFIEISPALLSAALVNSPKEAAAWLKANQDKVKAYFDAHTDEFAQAAGFDFHVLKYSDEAKAAKAVEGLKGKAGEELRNAMAALAGAESEDKTTNTIGGRALTALTPEAIESLYGKPVADAVAGLTEMQVSPVVKSQDGFYVLMLDTRRPEVKPEFDRVSDVIARRLLGEEKAAVEIDSLAKKALDAVNAAPERPLADIAAELNAAYAPHQPVRAGETGEVHALPATMEGMLFYDPETVPGIGKGREVVDSLVGLTADARVLQKPLKAEGNASSFIVRLKGDGKVEAPTPEEINLVSSELALFKRLAVWRDWYEDLKAGAAASGDLVEKESLAKMIADDEKALEQAAAGKTPDKTEAKSAEEEPEKK